MTDDDLPDIPALEDLDPILRAAVTRFAREGFGVPLRPIAADAGVSAALILKRYGSKEGLRAACDRYVTERVRALKSSSVHAAAAGTLLTAVPEHEEQAITLGYLIQALLDGGQTGREVYEQMAEDAEGYIAEAVAAGVARPSRDEAARARFMTQSGLGSILVRFLLAPAEERGDLTALLRSYQQEVADPIIELYTEGFFADPDMLEGYAEHITDPDRTDPRTGRGA